jgi:hypothetical protein
MGRMWWHALDGNRYDPSDNQRRKQHAAIVAPLMAHTGLVRA